MNKRGLGRLLLAVAVVAVVAAAVVWMTPVPNGSGGNTATIGGPFELVDGHGGTVRDTDFRGHLLLVYFGYTHCPDVCPTTLNTVAEAFAELTPAELAEVDALFISVDPKRDHGEVLDDYTSVFHEKIRGVTGTVEQLDAVAKAYRATYRIGTADDPDYYPVDHSAILYLMDRNGKYITHFSHQSPVAKVVEALKKALADDGGATKPVG